jgi:hypothetical protein
MAKIAKIIGKISQFENRKKLPARPALTLLLPSSCPALARFLPGSFSALAWLLHGSCPALARLLPGSGPTLARLFPSPLPCPFLPSLAFFSCVDVLCVQLIINFARSSPPFSLYSSFHLQFGQAKRDTKVLLLAKGLLIKKYLVSSSCFPNTKLYQEKQD